MLLFTTILAYLSNVISAIRKKKSIFVPLILIVFAFVIMAFVPSYIPDYSQYNLMYYFDFTQVEKGYDLLSNFFFIKGVEYQQFRIITTIMGLILISIATYRFTNDLARFWSIYFLFPFFMDIIQVRNFLMMSFVLLAASFLINPNFKNIIIYIFLIVVSASFQNVGYFFLLPLVFLLFKRYKLIKQLFIMVITFFCIISIINRSFVYGIIAKLVSIIGSESMITSKLTYYVQDSVNYGFLIYWIVIIAGYFIINYSINYATKIGIDEKELSKLSVIESFSITALVSLPLIMVSLDFYRIARDIFPLVIIAYVIVTQEMQNKHLKNIVYKVLFYFNLALSVVLVYRVIWITGIYPVLFDNTLF